MATRKPAIWAVSISKLGRLFHGVIPDYSRLADIQIIDKGFEEALPRVRELAESGEADVFVSGGSNGAYLRERVSVPVVLIEVNGFDLLHALSKACAFSRRIGVITFDKTLADLERFTKQFKLQIEQRFYRNAEEAEACVRELAASGIEVIVGPGLVTELAEQVGIRGIFLYSESSVRTALDDAIEMARVARIEEARREHLNTILQHLDEGVVAVDAQERIQSMNPAMEKLLGVSPSQTLGKRLSDFAPDLGLRDTLTRGKPDLEEIARIGHRTIVINRIPISEHGVQTGAVLTSRDSTAIQRVERSLRSQNRPRHFVAKYRLPHLIGTSETITEVRALAHKYASTGATVLITGESGTGKELLAQGIHNASERQQHPFVAINCAAFPESLLESELFGYEDGAFTGSRRGGKAGLFECAHTGTIFLDEVGDMPLALQTRLLRVLQEREVLRLGSNDATPVDVRVIAATNRSLKLGIAEGWFREDLYYRLNILHLRLPPLRERPEDLPILATHLLSAILRRLHASRPTEPILAAVRPYLEGYYWPGNVRELENILERIAVFCSALNSEGHLGVERLRNLIPEIFAEQSEAAQRRTAVPLLRSVSRAGEIDHILKTLEECGGNRTEACKRLGIGRTTLWRKLNGKA